MARYDEDKEQTITLPEPTMTSLFEEISQVLSTTQPKDYPSQLPGNINGATNKFIGLINFNQDWSERPRMNRANTGWVWPFRLKIILLLEKYIYSDDLLRDTIDSAKLVGVDWRGDDFNELVSVINEHEKMNEIGVEVYRKQAIEKMKNLNFAK